MNVYERNWNKMIVNERINFIKNNNVFNKDEYDEDEVAYYLIKENLNRSS